jgi:hypothetical protein
MTISYQSVTEDNGYELEPNLITYTGSASGLAPTHVVHFDYTNDRPDTELTYVGGLKLLHTLRLALISIGYQATGSAVSPLKTYSLGYQRSASSNRSLLSSVKECDGAGVCKPSTTFEWSALPIAFTDSPGSPALPSAIPAVPANCPSNILRSPVAFLLGSFPERGTLFRSSVCRQIVGSIWRDRRTLILRRNRCVRLGSRSYTEMATTKWSAISWILRVRNS